MEEVTSYISKDLQLHYDPTHTVTLRNVFAREMKRRFRELTKVIKVSVVDRDCFGLKSAVQGNQMNSTIPKQFNFGRSSDKVAAFMAWLQQQVEKGILDVRIFNQVGSAVESAWTNRYIYDSYKRGVLRARQEMLKVGMDIPSMEETGGINATLSLPFHVDRLGLLFTRTFNDLKGITDEMDTLISRVLTQGIADGDSPLLLARKLVEVINNSGGDLSLVDSLGRFISAERRAVILARTEIIRAHHVATIQEYRNWGVLGIKVLAEWQTAGDDRVCDKCSSLQGKIYTLDEIEGKIPLHPQCFIDPQIPIYTSKGWKPIGKIEIGDLVLTHKRRFRKVYALPRHKEKAEVVTLKFSGNRGWLTITTNHPVLVTTKKGSVSRWVKAGNVKEGDYLSLLGNICKRCGKPIPYFRKYCSRTCLSKDITDVQWTNPDHRKLMSKKTTEQLHREYASGIRNGKTITIKAHERTRQMGIEGIHPFQREDVIEKHKILTHTLGLNKRHSERMKKNNPMHDPIIVEKAQKAVKEFYINNPERRLNILMSKHRKSNNMTSIEKRMCDLLNKIGIQYVYQYPILNYNVDFAIPGLKIVIECDGEYWHQDKMKDKIRDQKIEKEGWSVLHYSGTKINQCLDEIEHELSRVLCNHLGEYDLVAWPVIRVKKWTLNKVRLLYNLSVEDDESYVAKGVVVHNCRCIALPYIEELQKYN